MLVITAKSLNGLFWFVSEGSDKDPANRTHDFRVLTKIAKQIWLLILVHGRYGYRRITALLRAEGWDVNHKRVWRIWRREGLKVPMKQPKKGILWLNDGSCIRLRPGWKDHVWAYDFVHDRTLFCFRPLLLSPRSCLYCVLCFQNFE